VYFGREARVGAKRHKTKNIKYFSKPFRADNYRQHHEKQHPQMWKQYQEASDEEKKAFFETSRPVKETLHNYFGTKQVAQRIRINAAIVNVIIGELLWDPEDIDGETHSRMMRSFEDFAGDTEELQEGEGVDRFCIVIKNPVQFSLTVDYLSVGCSFRQAARIMISTKERTGLAAIGTCSDLTVAKYARYACAINLQKISELLDSAWTFAVALDMSTHMSTSYLDIRIRLHLNGPGIINMHLLAIPIFERHTGLVMFQTASRALDVLCPTWRDIIIGISTDGERKMTGHVSGVATRFQQVAKPGFTRIWCGAHQLEIVLQECYTHFGNDQFYGKLTSAISYLRRQQNLIADIRSKAPKVADTRWESMSNVSSWFKLHKIAVDEYFENKKPSCKPPPRWWVEILIIDHFAGRATIAFKQLQGHAVTASMQRARLASLQAFYLSTVDGKGPLLEAEANALDDQEWMLSACRRFAGSYAKARSLVLNQGSFVLGKIEQVTDEEADALVKDVTKLYIEAASGISRIVAERDSMNEGTDQLPPVMPNELAVLQHSEFCATVRKHRERLLARLSTTEIDIIEQEHQELVAAYTEEGQLRSALNACGSSTTFDEAWAVVKGRFKFLLRFCGGLASIFPGTSQVESDFCIVKGEKNVYRQSLTDLSLEGVLHSKQFDMLKVL
jgi:hypothetical protein